MIEIVSIHNQSVFWEKTINYAEECSWKAGKYLSNHMKENVFKEWERVIIAKDEMDNIVGFCTITEKDELLDSYEYTPLIGAVFVDEKFRGMRISERLIGEASRYAKALGYKNIYIMSGEVGLYEKYGFKLMGMYETIFGYKEQLFIKSIV